ncbi:hypothetical protein [Rhizobium sp. LCM 4573]|uniref:hypothetical protein n=1 Tax=Rhizobium sp. LCM 4573 TaxID=1848291 RepID=UPI0008DB33D0|nr:hypothetical protein [Rhizobium sp. LCM 4573]OHV83648.1 hypothetical protein LCM4573_05960 [Rhizobium sp. LCM 4573]
MTHCADGLPVDGRIVTLVKMALQYEVETGRPGIDLTPSELIWRTEILKERDKLEALRTACAMATALSGNEKALAALTE